MPKLKIELVKPKELTTKELEIAFGGYWPVRRITQRKFKRLIDKGEKK